MLDVAAFKSEMNLLAGKGFISLLEILYDKSDPDPANWLYFRAAKYSQDVTFTLPQLGNPTHSQAYTFPAFAIGDFEIQQSAQGQIPGFELSIENIGREMMGIIELYEIERAKGRIIVVHPLKLADPTARIEEKFSINAANANEALAVIECVGVSFDPLRVMIPAKIVTRDEFPGIAGNDGLFVGGIAA